MLTASYATYQSYRNLTSTETFWDEVNNFVQNLTKISSWNLAHFFIITKIMFY